MLQSVRGLAGAALALCFLSFASAHDLVLTHGKIFTANPEAPFASALVVRDDRILAVGTLAEVLNAASADAETLDLGGKLLLPGLIDAHVHALQAGYSEVTARIPESARTAGDLRDYAQQAIRSGSGLVGDVLRLRGPDHGLDIAVLSQVFNATPFDRRAVVVVGTSGHDGWVNKAMLRRARIDRTFISRLKGPDRVFYGHDSKLEPDGHVLDTGWDKVQGSLPPPSLEVLKEAGRTAIRDLNRLGLTAWMEPLINRTPLDPVLSAWPKSTEEGVLPAYRALEHDNEMSARVTGLVLLNAESGPEALDVFTALAAKYPSSDRLKVAGIKIFADGVLEGRTAVVSKPYPGTSSTGNDHIGTDRFKQLVKEADRRGALVHIHAIGDQAITEALDAFGAARSANGMSRVPHSITHLDLTQPKDFSRFAQLNVIAVMQLLWVSFASPAELSKVADPDLLRHLYPARSIYTAGGTLAGASDWYVSSANPFLAIASAMRRKGPEGPVNPEEAMTAEEMLYAYTRNAARAVDRADEIGSIEVGKRADLVLVDRDVLIAPPEEIANTRVLFTMFAGRLVYQAAR